ncbi:MAG: V-type ATP synthase subunit I, partial [Chlamydiales bacterium]|nr:V-type ATP synthase subunit I [Chlamydiales bacterium]
MPSKSGQEKDPAAQRRETVMIIDVKKYLLIGAQEEIDRFFSVAQDLGVIEFIPPAGRKEIELSCELQLLSSALKILRKLPLKRPYFPKASRKEALEIAQKIIDLKAQTEVLSEEKRMVEAEISRVAPLGNFSLDDIDYIEKESGKEVRFFCMKTSKSREHCIHENCGEMIPIATEYDLDYFMALCKNLKPHPDMIEMRIDRPVGQLRTHLDFIDESLHQVEAELKGFAGHIDFLQNIFIGYLNHHHLDVAKKEVSFPIANSLFAIEAWVPQNKVGDLIAMTQTMAVHAEPIAIEEGDKVPTCMQNTGTQKMGEDLVKIYDIPSFSDRDPSGWIFWSFALFFAMIVADGGYGLLYLGIILYVKIKYKDMKTQAKRFVKMALILSTACVIWGVATSAFFGFQLHPKSFLGEISPVRYLAAKKAEYHFSVKDDVEKEWVKKFPQLSTMHNGTDILDTAVVHKKGKEIFEMFISFSDSILLEFSLVIGILHIAFAFLRYLFRNWAGIGWVVFMAGAYLYFPKTLHATSFVHFFGWIDKQTGYEIGLQCIYCGGIGALVLALFQRRWGGLGEIANLVQVFADVLSYLRLYALGLAGSIMAATFNDIGQEIGLLFGWIVILFGHGVNILLG